VGAIAQVQFAADAGQVGLRGGFGDEQLGGDFDVAVRASHQMQHVVSRSVSVRVLAHVRGECVDNVQENNVQESNRR
jgi:hypothetical protein